MARLILFNKPYNVLSQFTDRQGRKTLSNFINDPELAKVYPAGRLDQDSEGLLLLTDSGQLQHRISNPRFKLNKTYWVQVEGEATNKQLAELRKGVQLKDGPARAISASILNEPEIWRRDPPIRTRKNIPASWISLTINEGRNRQVRRMSAAIGLPTLRLIRIKIGNWELDNLAPGEYNAQVVHLPSS